MTEAEWLAGHDWVVMLHALRAVAPVSNRKARLFGCACCRAAAHRFVHPASAGLVDLAERLADGLATEDERLAGLAQSDEALDYAVDFGLAAYHMANAVEELLEDGEADPFIGSRQVAESLDWGEYERPKHARLLHEHFGNPFRPVCFDPAWRTDTALTLARQMYESREFSAAPILADALQDAGCDADDLLNHLRDPHAAHVRGCWALDLVLGKA
jgi:hypothetical protein